MRVSKYVMPAIAVATLLGAVLAAKAVGAWQTSGRDMVDPTQPLTSADIRGWMPLSYLMEQLDLTQAQLYEMLGLPADIPPETPLKDLEDIIEVSEVRDILAAYLGEVPAAEEAAPVEAEAAATPTVLPPTATPVPESTAIDHVPGTGDGTAVGPTPLPEGQVLPAAEIKGRMTLQEVSEQCLVPLDVLYSAMGLPDGIPAGTALKDLGAQFPEFEIESVREIVASYQER
jgi:hypothetical protein